MQVHVMVRGNSERPRIENFGASRYLVYIKNAIDTNEGNAELVGMLSKYLGTPPSRIRLIRGHLSKEKVFEIY